MLDHYYHGPRIRTLREVRELLGGRLDLAPCRPSQADGTEYSRNFNHAWPMRRARGDQRHNDVA
jgi:hypothetical protein